MSAKRNTKKTRSIVEHIIYEFFGKGNLSRYPEFISKEVEVYVPQSWRGILPTTDLRDQEIIKKIDQEYALAFQFKHVDIDDLILGKDKILVRWSGQGIHRGNLFHLKATHRHFELTGQTIYQFNQEEQVSRVWQSWDMLGLVQQITPHPEDDIRLKLLATLSSQERECLKHLLQGKTAKETASLMNLSFRTVEYYFENVKNKLQCFYKRELIPFSRLLEAHSYSIR